MFLVTSSLMINSLSQGKPILARIKPKPMNRLPSGPAAPGVTSSAPTTPGAIVLAPSLPLVAPVPGAPANAGNVPVAAKNGYPRQPQQQSHQPPAQQPPAPAATAQVPQQQPQVIPYAAMLMPAQTQPQQVGMVAAGAAPGSAQALPAVSGQPPNMVSTSMAQAPYFVTSTNSAPNVQVSTASFNGATTILYVSG